MEKKLNKKLFYNREKELQNLDTLTEIFSFFRDFDASVSRLTCKWWNDLLTKDEVTIKHVKKNNIEIPYHVDKRINRASLFGYLEILKWYYDKTSFTGDWSACTCSMASYGGHLKILKWIRSNGFDWIGDCSCTSFLKHCVSNYMTCGASDCNKASNFPICAYAAEGGYLYILKWLRKNGRTFDRYTCSWSRQQFCVQNYLHSLSQKDCPCNCPRIQSSLPSFPVSPN